MRVTNFPYFSIKHAYHRFVQQVKLVITIEPCTYHFTHHRTGNCVTAVVYSCDDLILFKHPTLPLLILSVVVKTLNQSSIETKRLKGKLHQTHCTDWLWKATFNMLIDELTRASLAQVCNRLIFDSTSITVINSVRLILGWFGRMERLWVQAGANCEYMHKRTRHHARLNFFCELLPPSEHVNCVQ